MFTEEICYWFQRTFDPNTHAEISMFAALQLRIFISHWPSASPSCLFVTYWLYKRVSVNTGDGCVLKPSDMAANGAQHAFARARARTHTYRQDTRQTNCLFPPCCVSNLLIMLAKSSYTALPWSSMWLISQCDRHKYWPGVHNPCSHFSSISKVGGRGGDGCTHFCPTFPDLKSSRTFETLCLK